MKVRIEKTSGGSLSPPVPGAVLEGEPNRFGAKWVIEVDNLWALLDSLECELILKRVDGERVIEIYDDYRE